MKTLTLVITLLCASLCAAQTTKPVTGSVFGAVFTDANADGKWLSNERAVGSVTVFVDANQNGKLDPGEPSTVTSPAGMYSFVLPPGKYRVCEAVPAGKKLTTAGGYDFTVTPGSTAGPKNFGNVADLVVLPVNELPTTQPAVDYYVDAVSGNDANAGKTPATAWKTPRAVDHANVGLTGVFKLSDPLSFKTHTGARVGSVDALHKAELVATGGGNATAWGNASGCTLADVIVNSDDGKGKAGNVTGTNNSILNVDLRNLSEGFDYERTVNQTIRDGRQIGVVPGRCHYFLGCKNTTWTGGHFGPGSTQSPVRYSSSVQGDSIWTNEGGVVRGVTVDQTGSPNPIAGFAIHAASGVQFIDCTVIGGEFSFDSAGAGIGNRVENCVFRNVTITNSKLALHEIAFNNQVIGGQISNSTGESISLTPGSGNVIDGIELHSAGKHAIKVYGPSDIKIRNVRVIGPKGTPIIDGGTPANDAGGNTLQSSPTTQPGASRSRRRKRHDRRPGADDARDDHHVSDHRRQRHDDHRARHEYHRAACRSVVVLGAHIHVQSRSDRHAPIPRRCRGCRPGEVLPQHREPPWLHHRTRRPRRGVDVLAK